MKDREFILLLREWSEQLRKYANNLASGDKPEIYKNFLFVEITVYEAIIKKIDTYLNEEQANDK